MRIISRLLVMTSLLCVIGCAAQMNKMMASWEGVHYSKLLEQWGPPTQILDDGQGGRIYCYESTSSYTTSGSANTSGYGYYYGRGNFSYQGYTTYDPPRTYTYARYRMFWVNPEGYIYKWSWRGL